MKLWTVALLALAMAISGLSIGCNKEEGTPKTTTTTRPTTAPAK